MTSVDRPGQRWFDCVVFDFDGVCAPSAGEYLASSVTPGTLRSSLAPAVALFRLRGAQIVLLSNEFDRQWISTIAGFPKFDHVLVGSDNRIFKPDRRAFQRVLLAVGCEASRCLVIDDSETNCRVAESIGCQAIWFDSNDVEASWDAILHAQPKASGD